MGVGKWSLKSGQITLLVISEISWFVMKRSSNEEHDTITRAGWGIMLWRLYEDNNNKGSNWWWDAWRTGQAENTWKLAFKPFPTLSVQPQLRRFDGEACFWSISSKTTQVCTYRTVTTAHSARSEVYPMRCDVTAEFVYMEYGIVDWDELLFNVFRYKREYYLLP